MSADPSLVPVVRVFAGALGEAHPFGAEAERALIAVKRQAGEGLCVAAVSEFLTLYRRAAIFHLIGGARTT